MCVRASMKAAKPLHIVLATNPNPTRARGYPLNINPKPDPKPDSISGPAGSGRVADLYNTLDQKLHVVSCCGCANAHTESNARHHSAFSFKTESITKQAKVPFKNEQVRKSEICCIKNQQGKQQCKSKDYKGDVIYII